MKAPQTLIDPYRRQITYLRLSVTDRCDLRCIYCMDEQMQFLPKQQLLSFEEMEAIATAFASVGTRKIRVTGGEPLVRQGIVELCERIAQVDGIDELCMTTNGVRLPLFAQQLKDAGVSRLNISLDSLDEDNFTKLTRVGKLSSVLDGIDAALDACFDRVKLNCVVLKHVNHHETKALVEYALDKNVDISFIEEMPLGDIKNRFREADYYSSDEILHDLSSEFDLTKCAQSTGGPSTYYSISGAQSKVGFISPHSHNFCDSCNRVRLTATGKLLLCLGQENATDLKYIVRRFPGELKKIREAIAAAIQIKPKGHDFDLSGKPVIMRHMNLTGG